MRRFDGGVEFIAKVDVADLARWIGGITFEDWHQQKPRDDGQLRPAMMTDLTWRAFGLRTDGIVGELLRHFPGCSATQRMLSVVMPGDSIEPHRDEQPPRWICRVHAPIFTNARSHFVVNGKPCNMDVGDAYMVNTEAVHSVVNDGYTPRIHFMFDVLKP